MKTVGKRALGCLRRWAIEAGRRVRSWGRWVWSRVVGEPGYVETVADLAVAVAELFVRDPARRRIVRECARTLILTVRSLRHRDNESPRPGHRWYGLTDQDGDDLGWEWA